MKKLIVSSVLMLFLGQVFITTAIFLTMEDLKRTIGMELWGIKSEITNLTYRR